MTYLFAQPHESLIVREATRADVPLLKTLIEELGQHERLPILRSEEQLIADGFGEFPSFRVFLAHWENAAAGYALFSPCYSSFRGRGVFLEDLYVRDNYRGLGIGKALLDRIARIALENGSFGIELNVLAWNDSAMRFFKTAGAAELAGRKTLCIDLTSQANRKEKA